MPNLVNPTDEDARQLARKLMHDASFAAMAFNTPSGPMISRIGFALTPEKTPLTLVSGIAAHTRALENDPLCALLIGEPGNKGDPLAHPRLSLQVAANFVPRPSGEHKALAEHYAKRNPKAKLYLSLPDFTFLVFKVTNAFLNAGFGRAYQLLPRDLAIEQP